MQAVNVFYGIETTHGNFTLELFPDKAPLTVANFHKYVETGRYVNTVFNRIIPNFMIQGGGYLPDQTKTPTFPPIQNEATNGLKNRYGTVAMARTDEIHSATCQFFINLDENDHLDHTDTQFGYSVFGRVSEGIDVVERIGSIKTQVVGPDKDYPIEPVIIKQIFLL